MSIVRDELAKCVNYPLEVQFAIDRLVVGEEAGEKAKNVDTRAQLSRI